MTETRPWALIQWQMSDQTFWLSAADSQLQPGADVQFFSDDQAVGGVHWSGPPVRFGPRS